MSWAVTAVVVAAAATGASMYSSYKSAGAQEEALLKESELKTQERAKQTKKLAAAQRVSFLTSGISLTGEGTPETLISETYRVGKEDIGLIREKYGAQIKNVWSQTRTKMISDISSFAMGAATGTAGNVSTTGAATGSAASGQQLSSMTDTSQFGTSAQSFGGNYNY